MRRFALKRFVQMPNESTPVTSTTPKSFEEKLVRIDAIVKALESGNVELARATELFREGKALARECDTLIKSAQEEIDRAIAPDRVPDDLGDDAPF